MDMADSDTHRMDLDSDILILDMDMDSAIMITGLDTTMDIIMDTTMGIMMDHTDTLERITGTHRGMAIVDLSEALLTRVVLTMDLQD